MEDDPLLTYLNALARDECYRVEAVLKVAPHETTEVVSFVGANEAALGPFVRKRISGDAPLGSAYRLLWGAWRAGRRFRHLPRIYDVHEGDGELIVVMEYVAGRTLRDEVYARDGSLALAAELFPSLCDGVIELHEEVGAPLIHRDLKPSNVVVNGPALTIIDFGIARAFRAGAPHDTTHFGTRSYAPPEQFGYGQTDVRSDVYALGMILYYLLTERDPDPSVAAGGFAAPDVPPCLRGVLQRACAFDPAARFSSVRELKAAFLASVAAPAAPGPTMMGAAPVAPGPTMTVAAPGGAPLPEDGPPRAAAAAGGAGGSASAAADVGFAPLSAGKVWTARSIAVALLWVLFMVTCVGLPFDPGTTYAHWPLGLRMAFYWTFGPLFFTGAGVLLVGDGLFAKLFAPLGLDTRNRKRLLGWALIAASVLAVGVTTALASACGFDTRSS